MADPKRPKTGPSATAAPSLPIRAGKISARRSSGTRAYGGLEEESNRAKILAAIFTLALLLGVIIWLFAGNQQLTGETPVASKEAAGFTSPPPGESQPSSTTPPATTIDNSSATIVENPPAIKEPSVAAPLAPEEKPVTPVTPVKRQATAGKPQDAAVLTSPATTPPVKSNTPTQVASGGATPGKYTIQPGDTPATIAAKVLGDASKVKLLMKANPGMDPKRLKVGQEIKLPKIP